MVTVDLLASACLCVPRMHVLEAHGCSARLDVSYSVRSMLDGACPVATARQNRVSVGCSYMWWSGCEEMQAYDVVVDGTLCNCSTRDSDSGSFMGSHTQLIREQKAAGTTVASSIARAR